MRRIQFALIVALVSLSTSASPSEPPNCQDYDVIEMSGEDPHSLPAKPECSCEFPDPLRQIEHADPRGDATAAVARADFRLRSVATFNIGSYTPGVEDWDTRDRLGEVFIDGTGDVVLCYEHARLMLIAKQYAESYNKVILAEVEDQ